MAIVEELSTPMLVLGTKAEGAKAAAEETQANRVAIFIFFLILQNRFCETYSGDVLHTTYDVRSMQYAFLLTRHLHWTTRIVVGEHLVHSTCTLALTREREC